MKYNIIFTDEQETALQEIAAEMGINKVAPGVVLDITGALTTRLLHEQR